MIWCKAMTMGWWWCFDHDASTTTTLSLPRILLLLIPWQLPSSPPRVVELVVATDLYFPTFYHPIPATAVPFCSTSGSYYHYHYSCIKQHPSIDVFYCLSMRRITSSSSLCAWDHKKAIPTGPSSPIRWERSFHFFSFFWYWFFREWRGGYGKL